MVTGEIMRCPNVGLTLVVTFGHQIFYSSLPRNVGL